MRPVYVCRRQFLQNSHVRGWPTDHVYSATHTRIYVQTDVLANMTGADAYTCRNVRAGCAEYVAGAYSHPRIYTRGI